MFADFLTVIPQTHSVVLVTYRPEYRGTLAHVPGAQTISLAPLTDSDTTVLLDELLGRDSSVTAVRSLIADRAAGNPFFAQEIVRELAERGVLDGDRGAYACRADPAEVTVPATLQATIAARIDRLDPKAKRTLGAAAVIGSRFNLDLLTVLGVEPVVADLVAAEFVDQVRFTGQPEYVFHHPLIRSVAYESQLKSDRAELHRRLAAAIEARDPASADEKAASSPSTWRPQAISMPPLAGTCALARGRPVATSLRPGRVGSGRAQIADRLSDDDPDRLAMRIAPRTMLCGTAWRSAAALADTGFNELRDLCTAAGDKGRWRSACSVRLLSTCSASVCARRRERRRR